MNPLRTVQSTCRTAARPDGAAQLPSATTLRFLVLITATVGVTVPLVDPLVFAFRSVGVLPEHGREACVTNARAAAPEGTGERLVESYVACVRAAAQAAEALVVVGMLTPLLLGVVIYSVFPFVVRRRLAPLPRESHASLYERADTELRQALGPTRKRIRLLITPGTAGGARAFGAWGRYWVAVDRSALASGDPPGGGAPRGAAVIHHEAAHVRNRDIDITYLTISVWWGFFVVAVAMLPFVAVPPVLPQVALPLLASLVLLSYARSRVLRVRECYADVRAGQRPEIRAELSRLLSTVDRDPSASAIRWWSALHRRHPPAHERIAVLRDPARLLRGGLLDVLRRMCGGDGVPWVEQGDLPTRGRLLVGWPGRAADRPAVGGHPDGDRVAVGVACRARWWPRSATMADRAQSHRRAARRPTDAARAAPDHLGPFTRRGARTGHRARGFPVRRLLPRHAMDVARRRLVVERDTRPMADVGGGGGRHLDGWLRPHDVVRRGADPLADLAPLVGDGDVGDHRDVHGRARLVDRGGGPGRVAAHGGLPRLGAEAGRRIPFLPARAPCVPAVATGRSGCPHDARDGRRGGPDDPTAALGGSRGGGRLLSDSVGHGPPSHIPPGGGRGTGGRRDPGVDAGRSRLVRAGPQRRRRQRVPAGVLRGTRHPDRRGDGQLRSYSEPHAGLLVRSTVQ
ncbi:M48 family metalloprotease [Spiractinospora alimapuensis]|nr:M48 family metalloprotease [Spiractinospora alimapuensis]